MRDSNISVIVKTMMRPKCLEKLLKSIFKYYPELQVLIADDGEKSSKEYILNKFPNRNIEYYDLPKDSGLSYGRNYLLNKLNTKYFLLCDDDFVIDGTFKIFEFIDLLNEKNLDILGGYCRNYKIVNSFFDKIIVLVQKILKYELKTNYIGEINRIENTLNCNFKRKCFPNFCYTDICLNFFIAKTESIKKIGGWDNNLKLQEHTEFFYRAKLKGLKVGFTNKMSVKHFPIADKHYTMFRNRNYVSIFLEKYGLKEINYIFDEKEMNKSIILENLKNEERSNT